MSQNSINSLPLNLREMVERELKAEEQVRWIGQQSSAVLVQETLVVVVGAILLIAFSINWTAMSVPFIPFFLIGCALLCLLLVMRYRQKKTVYAITDRRAIVFAEDVFSAKIVSYQGDELGKLLRKQKPGDGEVGDILFVENAVTADQVTPWIQQTNEFLENVQIAIKTFLIEMCGQQTNGFLKIGQVREVEQMLKELAAQTTTTKEFKDEVEEDIDIEKERQQPHPDTLPSAQPISAVSRSLPMSVQLYLRLCPSFTAGFHWGFVAFGLAFALLFFSKNGFDDIIPRFWVDAGKAKITRVEKTDESIKFTEFHWVYAYHFEATVDGSKTIRGISYGYEGKHEIDNDVRLEQAGKRYRVEGLTLTHGGVVQSWLLFCWVFGVGVGGLGLLANVWSEGGKAIRVLQYGLPVHAKYVGMKTEGSGEISIDFEYQVSGKTYTVSAQAKDTSRLTDTEYKEVFYDPEQPDRSVVWDGLPHNIYYNKATGQFWIDPKRLILPLAAVVIVGCEIVAILLLGYLAI